MFQTQKKKKERNYSNDQQPKMWILMMATLITNSLGSYSNIPARVPSGIYLEGLSPARIITGKWTIISRIKIENLQIQSNPIAPHTPEETVICRVSPQECGLYQMKMHLWNIEDQLMRSNWEKLQEYLMPLEDFGENHRSYSSLLTEEDQNILQLTTPANLSEIIHYEQRQITYLPSGLIDIIMKLERNNEFIRRYTEGISQMDKTEKRSYYHVVRAIGYIEESISLRKQLIEIVTSVITASKAGQIHPFTFTPGALRITLDKINNMVKESVPPLNHGLGLTQLQEIITMKIVNHFGDILIMVTIPLLDKSIYDFYYIHPHPVPQNIGDKSNIYAYVNPPTNYLLIREDNQQYIFLSSEHLQESCKLVGFTYLCQPPPIFNSPSKKSDCIIQLIYNISINPHLLCDLRLTRKPGGFWQPLKRRGEWLYSLNRPATGHLTCPNTTDMNWTLNGTGKIFLNAGCLLQTQYFNLTTNITEPFPHFSDIIPEHNLQILNINPNLEDHIEGEGEIFAQMVPLMSPENLNQCPPEPEYWWKHMILIALSLSIITFIIKILQLIDWYYNLCYCPEPVPLPAKENMTPIRSIHKTIRQYENPAYDIPQPPRPLQPPSRPMNPPPIPASPPPRPLHPLPLSFSPPLRTRESKTNNLRNVTFGKTTYHEYPLTFSTFKTTSI